MFKPRHHAFPNASFSKRETALLPNDDVLPSAGVFTECFEENLLPNGVLLPNSAHRSVSSLYQVLVLTRGTQKTKLPLLDNYEYMPFKGEFGSLQIFTIGRMPSDLNLA
jgi:hypothetical protein